MIFVKTAGQNYLNTVAWLYNPSGVTEVEADPNMSLEYRLQEITPSVRYAVGMSLVKATCNTYGYRPVSQEEWVPEDASQVHRYPNGWSSVHIPSSPIGNVPLVASSIQAAAQRLAPSELNPTAQPCILYTYADICPPGVLWVPEQIKEQLL